VGAFSQRPQLATVDQETVESVNTNSDFCFSIPLHVFRFNFATCFAIVFPFDAKTQDTSELRYERPEFPFHLPLRTFQRNVSASLLGHLSHNGTCSKRRRSGSFGFGWLDPTLCVIPAQEATPSEASQRGASIYEFDACEEGMNIKIIQRAYCITRFIVLKLYNRYYTGKGQWDKHYACTQSARAVVAVVLRKILLQHVLFLRSLEPHSEGFCYLCQIYAIKRYKKVPKYSTFGWQSKYSPRQFCQKNPSQKQLENFSPRR